MTISTILQLQDFVIMFLLGICLGIAYGLINTLNNIHQNIFLQIFCDIIFVIIAFTLFFLSLNKINLGSLRLYLLIGYLLGFTIERITLGKLFAKGIQNVYNKMKIIIKRFKTSKLGKFIFK